MPEKVYMLTKDGYKQLEKKLKLLRTKERSEVIERIRQAKEFGQLEENTEYESAKEDQARIEQEIVKLEEVLRNAKTIEKRETQSDKVDIGTTITIEYLEEKKTFDLQIVSSHESNPSHNPPRISDESPVGIALMGREAGEEVEINVPLGKAHYKIISITDAI